MPKISADCRETFGQAPTRGVTIFLLRNKFLQVVDASLQRRKVRGLNYRLFVIMNFLWTVCSVSCVSHFDSARRALNASRTSTHHISTSYRTFAFGQAPTRGVVGQATQGEGDHFKFCSQGCTL